MKYLNNRIDTGHRFVKRHIGISNILENTVVKNFISEHEVICDWKITGKMHY